LEVAEEASLVASVEKRGAYDNDVDDGPLLRAKAAVRASPRDDDDARVANAVTPLLAAAPPVVATADRIIIVIVAEVMLDIVLSSTRKRH